MRILIADSFPGPQIERLEAMGHDVTVDPGRDAGALAEVVAGYEALVVRSTKVTAETIEAADRLALIVRAGAGVNTIDTRAAADHGVIVANTPGKNAVAVAELTMGLIMAIDRSIPDNVAELRAGVWNKKRWSEADGLHGKRLGIVGMGAIGAEVARRAHAFGMEIVVVDRPGRRPEVGALIEDLRCRLVPDLPRLLGTSDIVTFHIPASGNTAGMINREMLGHLRLGTVLINTSRGDIIDEEALLEAIEAKGLRVGLDVYADEPGEGSGTFTSALAAHPNVYGTHHIGASTKQAQRSIADEVVAIIESFGRGAVRNAVNVAAEPVGASVITVRHYDRVGVLAGVLEVLRRANLNVEQMENTVFAGANAASASIHLSALPDSATVEAISGLEHVIAVSVGAVGASSALVRPFPGFLPRPDIADEVAAPPLSVITADRYDRLVADHPLSILHVLRTAIDTADGVPDPALADAHGAAHLARLIDDGALLPQPAPAYYLYRVGTQQGSHIGVIAEVATSGIGEGTVRRHEGTRRETEDLVLRHLTTVRAHTDPVAMTYRTDPGLADVLTARCAAETPVLDFESDDGVRHQLWVVADAAGVNEIGTRLAMVETLYIIDGHHRSVAARRLAATEASENRGHTGAEPYNYFPAVLFAEDQLVLEGYHRALTDLGSMTPREFLASMRDRFDVEDLAIPWAEEARPREPGAVAMVVDGEWYRVTLPKPPADGDVYARLDAVVLQEHILGPLLGITEPATDPRLQYVPGPAGLGEFSRLSAIVGFALHPPSTAEVMAVADEGLVMPPKSTWFEPKVRAGLVVRKF